MFDELLSLARAAESESADGENPLDELAKLEAELGFSLRDDLAAALGGDAAVAIDGPLLPKPSWKVIVEVVDPSRLEYVLGHVIEAANRSAAEEGRAEIRFGEEEFGGRRFLTVTTADGTELATMSFVDGYLVAAASRALVLEAIAHRDAGTTLTAAQTFRERLPSDAETDFSALFWQDLGSVSGSLGQILGGAVRRASASRSRRWRRESSRCWCSPTVTPIACAWSRVAARVRSACRSRSCWRSQAPSSGTRHHRPRVRLGFRLPRYSETKLEGGGKRKVV